MSGMSDPGKGIPISTDHLFCIASNNKMFIGALILQLVDEGRISLDDPAADLVPAFADICNNATVRHLLSHTSGICDIVEHPMSPYRTDWSLQDPNEIWTTADFIPGLVSDPYFPAGQGWHYSSTNFFLLAKIAERITGEPLATEVRNRFLDPLNLDNTYISLNEVIPRESRFACNWHDLTGDGKLDDLSMWRPAILGWSEGTMFSTPADMAKWIRYLSAGKAYGQNLLAEALDFHPATGEDWLDGYGLGIATGDVGGVRYWGHCGWEYGYMSAVLYLPEQDTCVVLCSNENGPTIEIAAYLIVQTVISQSSD
jgi:D-alanyl-D-alanine carboxypeptidase